MKNIFIKSEYITLGQLLKICDLINSGGEAKYYLENHQILVNNEKENRRGRKLYPNDQIIINNLTYVISK